MFVVRSGVPGQPTEFRALGAHVDGCWALDGQEAAGSLLVFGRSPNACLEHQMAPMSLSDAELAEVVGAAAAAVAAAAAAAVPMLGAVA